MSQPAARHLLSVAHRRLGRRGWGVLLGLCWLACVLVGWRLWRHEQVVHHMLHPARQALTAEERAQAQARLPGLREVSFNTTDGLTLRGWYVPSRSGAAVVMVHGAGANRAWFLEEAVALSQRGLGVLLYDNRANGESDGDTQTWGDHEQDDLRGALDFVQAQPDVDPQRLGAVGFSIGAYTVAMVAAQDPRIRAVVLKAVWTSLPDELLFMAGPTGRFNAWLLGQEFSWAGVRLDRVHPGDLVAAIAPRPLLVVAGDQDRDAPMSVSRAVYEAAREPKQWRLIPGATHVDYERLGGDALHQQVAQFFCRGLASKVPAAL